MTEKRLAENIMNCHGRSIWEDYANGSTVGGDQMCDYYERYFRYKAPHEYGMALRHWVASCGLDRNGAFVFVMANHIQNC